MQEALQRYLKNYGFEKMHLKAVFFDMDGVLYDSMPNHTQSWVKTSDDFGLGMTAHDIYMNEGRTGFSTVNEFTRKQFNRDTTPEEAEHIYQCKCNYYNAMPSPMPMKGVQPLLQQIKSDGFQIVLVTGSGQHSLLNRLNADFPNIFHSDLMVTSFDVTYGKPNPEPYLMAMQKAMVKPWESIVVENAPLGVRSGAGAQAFTIACNTGPLPDNIFLQEGANVVLPSLQALYESWTSIRNAVQ